MLQRVITSVVGLVILAAVLIPQNSVIFAVAVGIFAAGMLWEFYATIKNHLIITAIGYLSAVIMTAGMFTGHASPAICAAVMLHLLAGVVLHERVHFKDVAASFLCTVFVTYFMNTLSRTMMGYGVAGVFFVFLSAWTTDTSAYFAGRGFGRHKLIPKVSPKKTVEGAIGGVLGCIVCNLIYVLILRYCFNIVAFDMTVSGIIKLVIFAACASVAAQLGDLSASAIKRDYGVKDFGKIFPGHGGILDRFDSVIFLTPVVYYFFRFLTLCG